jgi:hypothetical protein
MKSSLKGYALQAVVMLLIVAAGGCASKYYSVTDPGNGKTYYTPKVVKTDKKKGVIAFLDVPTGVPLTLTNARVTKITRKQFNQAVYSK